MGTIWIGRPLASDGPETGVGVGSGTVAAGTVTATGVTPSEQMMYAVERQLPSSTRGEGVLESAFDHYEPVRGEFPARERWDSNPLNRKEYLLHVRRRV